MDKQNITVLRKILYAVESGDQVYGKQDYSCFAGVGANCSNEKAITIGAGQWYAGEAKEADLARATGIRPNTINELYHELTERVSLEHLDLICEALNCELDELIIRVPNKETSITHTRQGTQKSSDTK